MSHEHDKDTAPIYPEGDCRNEEADVSDNDSGNACYGWDEVADQVHLRSEAMNFAREVQINPAGSPYNLASWLRDANVIYNYLRYGTVPPEEEEHIPVV
jgi:hypothetical protein